MNVLPCEVRDGAAIFHGRHVATANRAAGMGRFELGVRPEFVSIGDEGIPAEVVAVADLGRRRVVEARVGELRVNAVLGEGEAVAPGPAHLAFSPEQTRIYVDGRLAGERP
jgi:glycerol transport system ATP-binding protein